MMSLIARTPLTNRTCADAFVFCIIHDALRHDVTHRLIEAARGQLWAGTGGLIAYIGCGDRWHACAARLACMHVWHSWAQRSERAHRVNHVGRILCNAYKGGGDDNKAHMSKLGSHVAYNA